jgi:hypothetical protein
VFVRKSCAIDEKDCKTAFALCRSEILASVFGRKKKKPDDEEESESEEDESSALLK